MRHPAAGGSGGLRRSRALGSSVEFSDFREYAAGDDIRRVDWNAYARFDKLFLKLFMEEQEQRVHLIVDASASMDFGKWKPACQLAQTLGYLCLCGGDSVTVYTLGGGGRAAYAPAPGPALLSRAVRLSGKRAASRPRDDRNRCAHPEACRRQGRVRAHRRFAGRLGKGRAFPSVPQAGNVRFAGVEPPPSGTRSWRTRPSWWTARRANAS